MRRLLAFLHASVTAGAVFLYLFLLGTPLVLHAWLTRRIDPLYRVARWGCRMGLWVAGVRLEVRGRENLPRGGHCLYMCNHMSNIDPPLLVAVLPPRIAFMAKKGVFSIPVLGTAVRLDGCVPVDRQNPEAARESVEGALANIKQGVTFVVYPEGTRSRDGRLQRFKHGVFVLAIRAGVPIVPITLDGTRAIMAKGKWAIYPGTVRVTIHPPVETRGRSLEEREQLAEEIRAIVASALPDEQQKSAAPVAVGVQKRNGSS
ncbi:MAG: 1-acyl-sn-glycerol-3-phosphate acyltransferase [Acidobacteria bacterium]|nr:1-acyl-sn-glycerol-3-phosphate acyltransferase [Acidobacteriota bacterium]